MEFRAPAKVQGKVTAPAVLIGKKADVQFFRQLQVGSIEIRGQNVGGDRGRDDRDDPQYRKVDGNVVARSINVEKGGTFSGQLVIGPKKTWEQGELIPDMESTEPRTPGALRRPPEYPFGSPVT